MKKSTSGMLLLVIALSGYGQEPEERGEPLSATTAYQPASEYSLRGQRLLLQLSSTYFTVVKENEVNLDSSLLYASKSLNVSRLLILGEGIQDPELLAQTKWVDQQDAAKGISLLLKAKGKKRLQLLVLLGAYYAFHPDSYHAFKDSVKNFLERAIAEAKALQENSLGRQALCLLGKMYVQGGELVRGDSIFNLAIKQSQSADDAEGEARALAYRGIYTAYSPATTPTRITDLHNAAKIYRQLHDIEGEINAITDIGYLQVASYRLNDALESFLRALYLGDSISFPYRHYNTDAAAMVTTHQGKFGEPLRYTLETIKSAEIAGDSIGWAYFYSRLATLYLVEGAKGKECLRWMHKALNRFMVGEGDPSLYLHLNNMASVMISEGHNQEAIKLLQSVSTKVPPKKPIDSIFYCVAFATANTGVGNHKDAERQLLMAEQLQSKHQFLRGGFLRSMIDFKYGRLYFEEEKYRESQECFERFLSNPQRAAGSLISDLNAYSSLIYIDSVFQNTSSGLKRYKIYTQLLDSNFRISKIRQAEELQVTYQTEEQENRITLLTQEAKLEQARLEQANVLKNVTIGGSVLLFVIAGLLYRQNKLKQKSNNVITHKNGQLQHLLTEKEWLLKEIHHRVKNNFQTVMGLLGTQSAYLKNEIAINAITDSQHRIQAMSLIHQKLYQTDNLSVISMPDYIHELVDYLKDSLDIGNHIRFELDIEDIDFDLAHCIPLGLILNEAINNSFKYAFPDDRNGIISISLRARGIRHILSICDNGIGLPVEFNAIKSNSMGMNLMRGLSEEIGAEITIGRNIGAEIKVNFVYQPETVTQISPVNTILAHPI